MRHGSIRLAVVSLCALTAGASAQAEWVGGAFVSLPEWNEAATAAIGQQASVYRLFLAFSSPGYVPYGLLDPNFHAQSGTLYQNPFNGDLPPNALLEPFVPGITWDSYFGMGNLFASSHVFIDPNTTFVSNGVESPGGGAVFNFPNILESIVRQPGGVDQNGDVVIPASFDTSFWYTFAGQYTLLGVEADTTRPIRFDAGYIDSDIFRGQFSLFYNSPWSETTLVPDVQIVPSPGAGAAILLCVSMSVRRRHRESC